MFSNSLQKLDADHLIHPLSNFRGHAENGVTVMQSAHGCFLTDIEGNELLDGFAGLWCVNAGYGHQSIVEAATEQMLRLPYATGYFGYGSEPAIKLAAKIAEISPGDLNHVFFTLGGSDAVDTIIRQVRYFYNAQGKSGKKNFIALQNGFHGSSSNGAGLTALPVFHEGFDLPMQWQHHIPSPFPYRHEAGDDPDAIVEASVKALNAKIDELGEDTVAAFICELVQGSGGVIVPPEGFAQVMQNVCRERNILFIVDEVITGFGRTGPMFACEHEGLEPDFISIAKGLTSGYAPMGAALMADHVYDVIADALPTGVPFGHGLTYSGHPVSAAVGLEVIKLYEDGLIANSQTVGPYFETQLAKFKDHPLVGDVRSKGLLAAVELVVDKKTKAKPDPSFGIGPKLQSAGYENGLIFRANADATMAFAPPICISEGEIDVMIARIEKTLDAVDWRKEN
ncbi:MAG: aminotransferase class III-fold pyridoxal phosphate-dependent enzyme [Hyphomicrobiales bacterium]